MTHNTFLKVTLSIMIMANLFLILIHFLGRNRNEIDPVSLVELQTRVRIEHSFTSNANLTFDQLTNSLGKFEELLVTQNLLKSKESESFLVLVSQIDSLEGKLSFEELNNIPNYHELYMPSILVILMKSSLEEMLKANCDCFHSAIYGFQKYLNGDRNFKIEELIPIIDEDNLEADIVRKFVLLETIRFF